MKSKLCRGWGLLICLFLFPVLVHADVGMPEIKPYDVIVTNKDGIKLEDYYNEKSVIIPYDTKVSITMEYYNPERKVYLGYTEYQGVSGEIVLNDVRVASDKIDLKDFNKHENPVELYAIDDVEMYKGPSKIYGRVDGDKVIPKGTIVSYEYYDDIWAYVDYEGTKGWIIIYRYGDIYPDLKTSVANLAPKGKNKVLLTENIAKLKVSPNKDEEVSVNIPENTVLEYEYTYGALKSDYLYIDYEGTQGWLQITYYEGPYSAVGLVECECDSIYLISGNVYIYSKRGDASSKTSNKISAGVEIPVIYSYYVEGEAWYYVSYNDEEAWIMVPDTDGNSEINLSSNYGRTSVYKTKEELDVYELPSKDAKKVTKLDIGVEVDSYYDFFDNHYNYKDEFFSWTYVKFGDIKGWVLSSKVLLQENKYKDICTILDTSTKEEENKEEEKEEKKSKTMAPHQMAILAIGGAVVLALVVIVTIAIVNKKKQN